MVHSALVLASRCGNQTGQSNSGHRQDNYRSIGPKAQLGSTGAYGKSGLDNPDGPLGPVIPAAHPCVEANVVTVKAGQESSSLRMAPRKPRVDSAASLMPSESAFLANDRMRTCA